MNNKFDKIIDLNLRHITKALHVPKRDTFAQSVSLLQNSESSKTRHARTPFRKIVGCLDGH